MENDRLQALLTDFAANLRTARANTGLTMTQVAEAAGVSVSAVWYWERGKRAPTLTSLLAIAHVLETTAAELLEGVF